jgi:hypothetical protein
LDLRLRVRGVLACLRVARVLELLQRRLHLLNVLPAFLAQFAFQLAVVRQRVRRSGVVDQLVVQLDAASLGTNRLIILLVVLLEKLVLILLWLVFLHLIFGGVSQHRVLENQAAS